MGVDSTILLAVGGMSCGGCEGIVETAVSSVDGVNYVRAPFMSKKRTIVTVKLDQSVDVNKIFEALAEMDYTAEVIKKEDEELARQQLKDLERKKEQKEKELKEKEKEKENEMSLKKSSSLKKLNNQYIENEIQIVEMEPVEPSKVILSVRGMTCAGCQNTIEKVLNSSKGILKSNVGLLSEKAEVYYDKSLVHDEDIRQIINGIGSYEAKIIVEAEVNVLHLLISGMSSESCIAKIEDSIRKLKGIKELSINLGTHDARIKYDNDMTGPRSIIEAVTKVGYIASISEEKASVDLLSKKKELQRLATELKVALTFTIPVFFIGMIFHKIPVMDHLFSLKIMPGVPLSHFLLFLLSTPVQFGLGKRFYVNAYKAVRSGGANMDVLISLGTSVAYFYSCLAILLNIANPTHHSAVVFFDTSAMLITFVILGKFFETLAKGKTSEAIQKLMAMQPNNATLVILDEHDALIEEKVIEIDLVQRGDVLKVVPGARIPTDGIVLQGQSTVDESMISGESLPVSKKINDYLIAGTINQSGLIRMKATKVGAETGIAQIIRLVQDAQTGKAPIQSFADFVASWFVMVVVLVGITTFIVWLIVLSVSGVPVILQTEGNNPFLISLLFGISVVVIACPCALGLATPTAIMVGTGIGATNGVLIKGGPVLEMAHKITAVIFDKTGTLTYGKPVITDTKMLTDKITKNDFYLLVGSAEKGSEHPLALAITNYAENDLKLFLNTPDKFESKSGEGIKCTVNGRTVIIGNRLFMDKNQIHVPEQIDQLMQSFEREAKTVVIVGIDNFLAGIIAVADQVRPEAKVTVATLKKMGIQSWMVTGDNQRTANAIASQVGLHNVFAEVLPSMKAKKVKELKQMGHIVAMVGDGINDSPALAESDVGIAIGAGTDIAIEAAGMVLVKSDLRDVVTAIDLSKKTFNRIKINYVWAMFYNLSGIPLAAGILVPANIVVPPMIAGLAMAFSSVSVVGSSLMLKMYKKPSMAIVDPFNDSPFPEVKKFRTIFPSLKKKNTDEISLVEHDFLREQI